MILAWPRRRLRRPIGFAWIVCLLTSLLPTRSAVSEVVEFEYNKHSKSPLYFHGRDYETTKRPIGVVPDILQQVFSNTDFQIKYVESTRNRQIATRSMPSDRYWMGIATNQPDMVREITSRHPNYLIHNHLSEPFLNAACLISYTRPAKPGDPNVIFLKEKLPSDAILGARVGGLTFEQPREWLLLTGDIQHQPVAAPSSLKGYKMLLSGRLDFMLSNSVRIPLALTQLNEYDFSGTPKLIVHKACPGVEQLPLVFALSTPMANEMLQTLNQKLRELRSAGTLTEIVERYLPPIEYTDSL